MRKADGAHKHAPLIYERAEHTVSRKNIDPDALKIMRRLARHRYKAYLVGGGVRDLLLNKQPKDFDIATDATPRRIKALFRNCRIIGRRFKLAHIYFGSGKIIEVSTFRTNHDSENGDEANGSDDLLIVRDNTYGDERSDALRRDLTINALFYDASSFSIIDYVGGMEDLRNQVVRMIGDSDVRIAEDPVRMLRIVRHAARAEFSIHPKCAEAIVRNHELLLKSSPVRMYEELKKDLCSGSACRILQGLSEYNLLEHLVPELTEGAAALLSEESSLVRTLKRIDDFMLNNRSISATPVLAILALFSDTGTVEDPTLSARFDNVPMLVEFLKNTYSTLSVPRREREKIQRILSLWLELEHTPLEKIKLAKFKNTSCAEDLIQLLTFLNGDNSKDKVLKLLTERKDKRKKRSGRRRKHPVRKKDRRFGKGQGQRRF